MIRIGRWLTVVFLLIFVLWMLVISARAFPVWFKSPHQSFHAMKGGGAEVDFDIPVQFLAWIPALICAWGLWMWRRWAQFLTIALCAFGVAMEVLGLALFGGPYRAIFNPLATAVALLMILWLLLPSVLVRFKN